MGHLRPPVREVARSLHRLSESQAARGILLLLSAAAALLWANSPWSDSYTDFWSITLNVEIGPYGLEKHLVEWINDGLMALFFLAVALEIKREVLAGALASLRKAALPVAAAAGGMALPAGIFLAFTWGERAAAGWGIPVATDVAFALGILALLTARVPPPLVVFMAAFAIADDIGAILVIALFYTADLAWQPLATGGAVLALLAYLNWSGVRSLTLYGVLGAALWLAFLLSGVHSTVAGVLLAFTIPTGNLEAADPQPGDIGPLRRLEDTLDPWVALVILPLFAFANAGITLDAELLGELTTPLALGIIVGLVAGKQSGILGATWAAARLGAELPRGVCWRHIYGAGWLGGVGFTMSLFVADLAFRRDILLDTAKLGILAGSVIAGAGGASVLRFVVPRLSGRFVEECAPDAGTGVQATPEPEEGRPEAGEEATEHETRREAP